MGQIRERRRRAIIEAHGGKCWYCRVNPATQIDHVISRAAGGPDDLGNLLPACERCNGIKGGRRLPPEREEAALAAAAAISSTIILQEATPRAARPHFERMNFLVSGEMRRAINEWRHANHIDTEGEAFRQLIRIGLRLQGYPVDEPPA